MHKCASTCDKERICVGKSYVIAILFIFQFFFVFGSSFYATKKFIEQKMRCTCFVWCKTDKRCVVVCTSETVMNSDKLRYIDEQRTHVWLYKHDPDNEPKKKQWTKWHVVRKLNECASRMKRNWATIDEMFACDFIPVAFVLLCQFEFHQ